MAAAHNLSMFGVDEERLRAVPLSKENPDTRFETINRIGVGAFGTVFRCKDRATGEIVAVKKIAINHDEELEKVAREIGIMRALDHKNIVRYREAYCAVSCLWIAMEYCEGGSVDSLFRRLKQPLPEQAISYLCREILSGLVYLHNHRTIHRDIKSGNVLLTANGQVKLADFGISAQLTNTVSRRQHTGIGTFHWMAPEAISKETYDGKADVWSLGITCIEMAEMEPPGLNFAIPQLMSHIVNHPPPTLQNKRWSVQFHRFLARCLTKDPAHRPTAAELLNDPFIASNCYSHPEQEIQKLLQTAAEMERQQIAKDEAERNNARQRRSSGDDDGEDFDEDGSVTFAESARSGNKNNAGSGAGAGAAVSGAAGRYGNHRDSSDDDVGEDELVQIADNANPDDSLVVRQGSTSDFINNNNNNDNNNNENDLNSNTVLGSSNADKKSNKKKKRDEDDEEVVDEFNAKMKALEEEFDDEIVMNAMVADGVDGSNTLVPVGSLNIIGDERLSPQQLQQQQQFHPLKAFEQDLMKMEAQQQPLAEEQPQQQQWHTHLAAYLDGVPPVPVLTTDEFSLDEIVRATHFTCVADDDETASPVSAAGSYQYAGTTTTSNASGDGGMRSTSQQQQQPTASFTNTANMNAGGGGGGGGGGVGVSNSNNSALFGGGAKRTTWTCFTSNAHCNPSHAQLMALLGQQTEDEDTAGVGVGAPVSPPPLVPSCGITHTTESLLKLYGMMRHGVFEDVATRERALRAHSEAEKLGSLLKTLMNIQ